MASKYYLQYSTNDVHKLLQNDRNHINTKENLYSGRIKLEVLILMKSDKFKCESTAIILMQY